MSKRKALGKGLRSLIPEAPAQPVPPPPTEGRGGLRELDIDRVEPNAQQPRTVFTDESLNELAESLRDKGVLQPIVVRPLSSDRYELIAGERRWRAAQMAGLLKIPAVIRHVSDSQMLELALVENIQREELGAIETARALQTMMDERALGQQEVADRIGKPRSTVANFLRLLNLEPQVQAWIEEGRLSTGHAKALAAITTPATQIELAEQMSVKGLNVRQAEQLVARLRKPPASGSKKGSDGDADPNIAAAEQALQSAMGTRVRIVQRGDKGRIELHFFSHEEMERVYQRLMSTRN